MWRWTLAAALLALAAGCSRVPAPNGNPAQGGPNGVSGQPLNEEQVAKYVEVLGGRVVRDEKRPGSPVVAVTWVRPQVADADVKELAALQELRVLNLSLTAVTDAGLKELRAEAPDDARPDGHEGDRRGREGV